jgi:hypothetical protein
VIIIAKKKLEFKADGQSLTVLPLEAVNVPDWVTKTKLYKWAKKDGTIAGPPKAGKEPEVEPPPGGADK